MSGPVVPSVEELAPEGGIVDSHVHVFPERLFEAVWRYFETRGWAVHHQTASTIAQTLRGAGVERAVALCYAHKASVARPLNRFMAELGRDEPFFLPFATVHVDDPDLPAIVDEAMAAPTIHGFKLQPLVQRFSVDDRRLTYLYERALEARVPLVLHAGTGPVANEHVGFAPFRRLMERHPALRVIVAHMGAFEFDAFLGALADYPSMLLDTTMINVTTDLFDTTWRGDEALLARHADRICFGSDWPNVPYPYQEALASVGRFPVPAEALPGILGGNARRFLGL